VFPRHHIPPYDVTILTAQFSISNWGNTGSEGWKLHSGMAVEV